MARMAASNAMLHAPCGGAAPPFLLMGGRSVGAGAVLLGLPWLRTSALPQAGTWPCAAAGGLLLSADCHGALAPALRRLPSGLAAVVLATGAFWIALLAFVAPSVDGRRPRTVGPLAMVPGLTGVALIAWQGGADPGGGAAAEPAMSAFSRAAGSAVSWAALSPLVDRCRPGDRTGRRDLRRALKAILRRHRNGATRRAIPAELGPCWRAARSV